MKRIWRFTSLPLLTAAAATAALGIGLDAAAPAAADPTSVSTPSSNASAGGLMQLQIQMNHGANSQYTEVANIMKTKHGTVKNSIGNVR